MKLIIATLLFLFKLAFKPTAEKAVVVTGAALICNTTYAQIRQPSASTYPLVREWRLNVPFVGQSGNPLYDLHPIIALDTFYKLTLNGKTLIMDSLLHLGQANVTKFIGFVGSNSTVKWVDWDTMVSNMNALTPEDTTTMLATQYLVETVEEQVHTKQDDIDTVLWDATKHFVESNFYPLSNPADYARMSDLAWGNISGKPSFATVATTGDYDDLTNKPSIPAAQVNSDWSSNSGLSEILNKPDLSIYATTSALTAGLADKLNTSDFSSTFNSSFALKTTSDLAEGTNLYWTNARGDARYPQLSGSYNNPTWLTSLEWSKLTSTPTTLSGYGITDGVTSSGLSSILGNYVLSTTYTAGLATKFNIPSGTTSQYVRGDGSLATFPAVTTYTAGTGININGSNVISNTSPDQTVTLTAGRGISITGTYPNFTISLVTPTITNRNTTNGNARATNSNFTISTTKEAIVSYSLTCTVTNPLATGSSTASVFMEYSTDGGTTWQLPGQNGNSSAVGVAVAIAITNGQTVTVSGIIPANALVRLRTATTGTASVVYVTGQETVY